MSVSLDGHIAGPDGAIDWAAPDKELLRFHNEQTRELTGHLCGRGLYEDMLVWATAGQTRTDPWELEFARIWTAIPKMVFSTGLTTVEGCPLLRTERPPGRNGLRGNVLSLRLTSWRAR
jgi:hypothetical protein